MDRLRGRTINIFPSHQRRNDQRPSYVREQEAYNRFLDAAWPHDRRFSMRHTLKAYRRQGVLTEEQATNVGRESYHWFLHSLPSNARSDATPSGRQQSSPPRRQPTRVTKRVSRSSRSYSRRSPPSQPIPATGFQSLRRHGAIRRHIRPPEVPASFPPTRQSWRDPYDSRYWREQSSEPEEQIGWRNRQSRQELQRRFQVPDQVNPGLRVTNPDPPSPPTPNSEIQVTPTEAYGRKPETFQASRRIASTRPPSVHNRQHQPEALEQVWDEGNGDPFADFDGNYADVNGSGWVPWTGEQSEYDTEDAEMTEAIEASDTAEYYTTSDDETEDEHVRRHQQRFEPDWETTAHRDRDRDRRQQESYRQIWDRTRENLLRQNAYPIAPNGGLVEPRDDYPYDHEASFAVRAERRARAADPSRAFDYSNWP